MSALLWQSWLPRLWSGRARPVVDYRFFGVFRVLFGICIGYYAAVRLVTGHVQYALIDPVLHFHYSGFSWVQPLPEPFMTGTFVVLAMVALAFAAGIAQPWTSAGLFILYTYTVLIDKVAYNNHYYLLSLLCLYFCFGKVKGEKGPRWFLDLFRCQIALVYFFAGVAKWNRDWLVGEPMKMWLEPTAYIAKMPWLADPNTAAIMSVGGLALDLSIGPLLLYHRTRYAAVLLITGFHLSNEFLFTIGVFPAFMVATNLLFMGEPLKKPKAWPKLAVAAVILQLLIPLRHLLIPGPVAWTEDGHRYSWRMKLRSKRAQVLTLQVGDRPVNPLEYLTPRQLQKVGGRPDILHDFAQQLSQRNEGASVRAHTIASLNGRPPQTFVSPDTDLTKVEHSAWKQTSWVEDLKFPYLEKNQRRSMRASLGFWYCIAAITMLLGVGQWRKKSEKEWLHFCAGALLTTPLLYWLYLSLAAVPLIFCSLALAAQGWLCYRLKNDRWLAVLSVTGQALFWAIYGSILWIYPLAG